MPQTIAVISDIHGNLPALEAVLADLRQRGVSDVVNLGDHASGPLWPRETVALLMRQSWRQIAGNHDRQVVADRPDSHGPADRYAFAELTGEQRQWLAALPVTLEHPAGVWLCHGTPTSDLEFLLDVVDAGRLQLAGPDHVTAAVGAVRTGVIVCGHSHVPRTVRTGDGRLVVNPGSVGLQAFREDGAPPYRSETGSPHARYALLQRPQDAWSVSHIAVAYDFEAAGRRADANGQPAWGQALRTGFAG